MRRFYSIPERPARWSKLIPLAITLPLSVAAAGPMTAYAQTPPAEVGVWLDDTQQGAVEIYICQDRADRLCGRIVWLRDPLNAEGKPKFDRYNPNAALQGRPICGLPVIGNLARSSDGGFDDGWIYDPKVGKSYSAAIVLNGAQTLTVTGYLGMKFMGKSFSWTRAPDTLQRCNASAAPAATPMKVPAQPQAPIQKPSSATAPQAPAGQVPAKQLPAGQSATSGQASTAQKKQAAPTPPPKAQASTGGGAQKPATEAAAKPQTKSAPAVSASPVITQQPKPAKKTPAPPADEADALPWQAR